MKLLYALALFSTAASAGPIVQRQTTSAEIPSNQHASSSGNIGQGGPLSSGGGTNQGQPLSGSGGVESKPLSGGGGVESKPPSGTGGVEQGIAPSDGGVSIGEIQGILQSISGLVGRDVSVEEIARAVKRQVNDELLASLTEPVDCACPANREHWIG